MSITKDALQFLAEQAEQAKGVTVLPVPGEASHIIHTTSALGVHDKVMLTAPLRQVQLLDIPSLVNMAKRLAAGDILADLTCKTGSIADPKLASITVSPKEVRLYLDTNDLREYFYVPLQESDAFRFFSGLSDKEYTLSQTEILDALRYRLIDTLSNEDSRRRYIDSLSAIEWQTNETANVNRSRGSDTLGLSVNQQVKSKAEIGLPPDVLVFNVNRYVNVPVGYQGLSILCAFDMDTRVKKFILRPLGPAWETYLLRTVQQITENLAAELKDTGIPVYTGTLTKDR